MAGSGRTPGVVYTRAWTVEVMLDLAGLDPVGVDLAALRIVEPSGGEGAFALPLAARLLASCRAHGRDIVSDPDAATALRVVEIDWRSADRCRHLLAMELVRLGVPVGDAIRLGRGWVAEADFLLAGAATTSTDVVVGNPPYVRVEQIDAGPLAAYRKRYPSMLGQSDLYIGFLEAALRALRPGGVCVFVIPDRWLSNRSGAAVRGLITRHYAVEVIAALDEGVAFEEHADVKPVIVAIRRGVSADPTVVAHADVVAGDDEPGRVAGALTDPALAESVPGLRVERVPGWAARGEVWRVRPSGEREVLARLEREFPRLQDEGPDPATTAVAGFSTGADAVFLTTDREAVEADRMVPAVAAADVRGGELDWTGRWFVSPWDGVRLIRLDGADAERWPRLVAYLRAREETLRKRPTIRADVEGDWYRPNGRPPVGLVDRPALYFPGVGPTGRRLEVALVPGGTGIPTGTSMVARSSVWDLAVLGGILRSDVIEFQARHLADRIGGDRLRLKPSSIGHLRVPRPESVPEADAVALAAGFRGRDDAACSAIVRRLMGLEGVELTAP